MHYGMPEKDAAAEESTTTDSVSIPALSHGDSSGHRVEGNIILDPTEAHEALIRATGGRPNVTIVEGNEVIHPRNPMDEVLKAKHIRPASNLLHDAYLLIFQARDHVTPDTDWMADADAWLDRYRRENT